MPSVQKDIGRELAKLGRNKVRLRLGTITDTDPISVEMGASGVSYTDVQTLNSAAFDVGDIVAVLAWGNDRLIIGAVTGTASPGPGGGVDKYTELIGDGAADDIAVSHGLATTSVAVQVFEEASGEEVYPEVEVLDANQVQVSFAAHLTPTTDQYRVVVFG